MADYDSDSSDGEFDETNVLLGYASKDADQDTISRIGGYPEWLEADQPPSAAFARCKICKNHMALLLQLNGELPDRFPGHERRIYVFACRRTGCSRREGSVRALRAVRVWKDDGEGEGDGFVATTGAGETEERETEEVQKPRLGDAVFGGGSGSGNPFALSTNANPFSSAAGGDAGSNPFSSNPTPTMTTTTTTTTKAKKPTAKTVEIEATNLSKTFAETLSINTPTTTPTPASAQRPSTPPEPWPAQSAAAPPKPYPMFYLADADYETLDPEQSSSGGGLALPAGVRLEDADAPETVSAADKEAFESAMDTTFQKFADRLAQNPEQVIRYEFGGTPLLSARSSSAGAGAGFPRCAVCDAARTFEVQMTPHAITVLEADDDDDVGLDGGMEWVTIVVAVCERDCVPAYLEAGETAYLEEWAGVQWEETLGGGK